MASEVLRNAVFALYGSSPVLGALGLTSAHTYPAYSVDSPPEDRFLVLRWEIGTPAIATARGEELQCWVYHRQPDYGPIAAALKEIRRILPTLEGVRMSPTEAVFGIHDNGESGDLYDDGYKAWTRYASHTIMASGG